MSRGTGPRTPTPAGAAPLPQGVRTTREGWPLVRPQLAQYFFSLISMLIVLAILALLSFGLAGLVAGACVGGVFLLLQVTRGGVVLRPDAVVDRLPLGTRTTPWSSVIDVQVVAGGGAQLVQLTLVDGRRLKLYQPRSGGVFGRDPAFADKAALVRSRWIAGRADAPSLV